MSELHHDHKVEKPAGLAIDDMLQITDLLSHIGMDKPRKYRLPIELALWVMSELLDFPMPITKGVDGLSAAEEIQCEAAFDAGYATAIKALSISLQKMCQVGNNQLPEPIEWPKGGLCEYVGLQILKGNFHARGPRES